MSTMTLRGIDDVIASALKEKARQEDSSINTVVLNMLKVSLGLERKKRSATYNDLDHLAGTWSEQDYAEFTGIVADFDKVDDEMWR